MLDPGTIFTFLIIGYLVYLIEDMLDSFEEEEDDEDDIYFF